MSKNPFQVDRNKPFEHRGHHGTILKAPHMDLSKGIVVVHRPANISDSRFARDMTEIIGWWITNIYQDMITDGNGFPGFDAIAINVVEV